MQGRVDGLEARVCYTLQRRSEMIHADQKSRIEPSQPNYPWRGLNFESDIQFNFLPPKNGGELETQVSHIYILPQVILY
jgi:hypothetical protein